MDNIAHPNLNGIDSQQFSQLVHLPFGGKQALWSTKSAKCTTRNIIGIHSISIKMDVWDYIGSSGE